MGEPLGSFGTIESLRSMVLGNLLYIVLANAWENSGGYGGKHLHTGGIRDPRSFRALNRVDLKVKISNIQTSKRL